MLIENLKAPQEAVYYLLAATFGFLILYAIVVFIRNRNGSARRERQPLIPSLLVQASLLVAVVAAYVPLNHFFIDAANVANRGVLEKAFPKQKVTDEDLACAAWALATDERKKECVAEQNIGALAFQPVARGVKVSRVRAEPVTDAAPQLVCRPFKKGFHLYAVFADGTEARIKTPVAGMDLPLADCGDGKPIPSQVP